MPRSRRIWVWIFIVIVIALAILAEVLLRA